MSRTSQPMIAKQADATGSASHSKTRGLPPNASPKDVFESLAQLIADGHITPARQLIAEAVRAFPDHRKIRLAEHVLGGGKATPNPYVQPTATAESEWLDDPPEEARGKWVALIGSELVGMADSADELMRALAEKQFEQIPLVQHLAA